MFAYLLYRLKLIYMYIGKLHQMPYVILVIGLNSSKQLEVHVIWYKCMVFIQEDEINVKPSWYSPARIINKNWKQPVRVFLMCCSTTLTYKACIVLCMQNSQVLCVHVLCFTYLDLQKQKLCGTKFLSEGNILR